MRKLSSKYWILIFFVSCIIFGPASSTERTYNSTYENKSNPQYRFTLLEDKGQVERLLGYDSVTITGKVKNNTNKNYSYVQITFNLYDKDDNQVGSALANINNLEPNGTWIFKAIGIGENIVKYKCTGIDGW